MRRSLWIWALLLLAACAGPRVVDVAVTDHGLPVVQAVRVQPKGGPLSAAIETALFARGYKIATTAEMHADAVVDLQTYGGRKKKPDSVAIRVTDPQTKALLATLTWKNGYAGRPNSMADKMIRKGSADAARDIADHIVRLLSSRPDHATGQP